MADVLTKSQRSYNMSMIRSGHTGPEKTLRHLLTDNGFFSFVTHPKNVSGKPDFYFPDQRVAVFLDGCFWHGCKSCHKAPNSNTAFWSDKVSANIKRDKKVDSQLRADGIIVIRIREHELLREQNVIQKMQRVLNKKPRPRVLDLFAGAGGFSEGFMSAGCEMIAHIEMDADACSTIQTRMVYHALRKAGKINEYKKYLQKKIDREKLVEENSLQKELDSVIHARISRENCKDLVDRIRDMLAGEKLDIIIGGPPCQAYSHIGRSSDKKKMRRDQRKFLYHYYVEFLREFSPKIFVFENVPGLLSSGKGSYLKDMRKMMRAAGYETGYSVLNTSDFGVPQDRKRVILIGWRKDSELKHYPDFKRVERTYKVADFLDDLPALKAGTGLPSTGFKSKSPLLRQLGIVDVDIPVLLDHVARPQSKRDLEIYKLAVRKKNAGKNIRYNELPARLKTHKNETAFLDRFKVVDRLSDASHTVIAHISKDGHYYIHPDLKQNRALTVREAARLQTFPDNYVFEGSRTSQFRQIGNAVPPMFAKIIADELMRRMC